MRVVIQRTLSASVTIGGQVAAAIGQGLLVLVGIEESDTAEDIEWLVGKIANLRIFADDSGVMNLSVKDVGGEVLIVSQFTLHAMTKKGNRPSYIKAARPETSVPLYEAFVAALGSMLPGKIRTGVFAADMKVALVNDGPVTIIIDSKNKE
ncbi:D-tyrosyl-tRNA(Tyr) deacylase [Flavobacterium magnum]|uniref:D-aminoacyl-tRNA deacylase n=1 Tax=Flavobacterium magnum TaxID=2162713 RepID=A0A2S0RD19_9FLAO|nr:D-aminoacyl-tRNA deacylase [Flavobacterium magnum]AWA29643.1 D-tyrosyl-tRNA(Tyr) deacylase [Flavobacterium magnum]